MGSDPKGLFVISVDLEMSWGQIHHEPPHRTEPFVGVRRLVGDLLGLMEEHQITATWAVVGHLFLSSCSAVDGIKHPDIVRPRYPWHRDDWYGPDPASDVSREPTWYAPDLVDAIRACRTPQEIGSHTFGHLIVGEPGCSPEAVRSDLAACRRVAAGAGIELRSLIFPRNSVGRLDLVREQGFTAYRGRPGDPLAGLPEWRRRLMRALDMVRPMPWSAVRPEAKDGLVNIPQTYFFDPNSTLANRVGTRAWSWLIGRRLRQAADHGSLFHLWFHPHNLVGRRERALLALGDLFRHARQEMARGRLENLSMGQLADRLVGSSLA